MLNIKTVPPEKFMISILKALSLLLLPTVALSQCANEMPSGAWHFNGTLALMIYDYLISQGPFLTPTPHPVDGSVCQRDAQWCLAFCWHTGHPDLK